VNPAPKFALAFMLALAIPAQAFAAEVVVAAAADLSAAVKEIAAGFEKRTGNTVKLTLGSSGNFHAQIVNGAPFDVFLSADVRYIRDLEKAGLTQSGSSFVYAIGRIVLWTPRNSPIDVQTLGMKALLQPQARRIAIANPDHAPYGRAAVSAMEKAGVYATLKNKLVFGENISQTAQFVQSGAADAGVLALSLALSEPMKSQGKYWEIPLDSYPRMEQAGVILRQAQRAGHSAAAREFMESLRGNTGRLVLQRYGFTLPDPPPRAGNGARR
jgi:molybdate transport system substrate-binding protein